jgi:hypothetical protein
MMHTNAVPVPSPIIHVFSASCDSSLSSANRKRFFRRMQRDLGRCGLITNHSDDLWIAIRRSRGEWRRDRHLIIDWFVDQPESREVVLERPRLLGQVLEEGIECLPSVARSNQRDQADMRRCFPRMLAGLIARAVFDLPAGEEV